ncbi:MAG: ATP-binding cassette domain-containing protein [Desulfobacteraceae bacterium]|nr:MAG: ATP-binding cassette domain-containing protein [Desulfobacteraceae bacterium]
MIHVENLTKYYDSFCAVDHISININKGEVLGLLGPNGAGKTTTLKMLTGYFKPTAGTIRVKDYSIEDNPLEIKRMIGYLPESSPFYKNMLVYDYLEYASKIKGIPSGDRHARLRFLADLCGLNDIMHKAIGELSKGLNQRVGLAHAMMNDPEILILDEPTQGLDPNQIVEIRNIIKKIGKEKTIIFSTHILSEAEATCDRIVIINKGKIVADGDTRELKASADKKTAIQLSLTGADLESVQKELQTISGIDGVEKIHQTGDGVLTVKAWTRSSEDLRESVYRKIKATDWMLLEFRQEAKTLETIFRDLTRQIN